MKVDEMVLVVSEDVVKKYEVKNFSPEFQIEEDLFEAELEFKPRSEMETNPAYKQLIPYCVLVCSEGIYCYQRTKKGGESRLHDKWSLGIGGHVNNLDKEPGESWKEAFDNGVFRELDEEVGLAEYNIEDFRFFGSIYNEDTSVNSVHFGLVYIVRVEDKTSFENNDPGLTNGRWVTLKELVSKKDNFEDWSKIIIDSFLEFFHEII